MKLDIKKHLIPFTLAVIAVIIGISIYGTGDLDPVVKNIPVRETEPKAEIPNEKEMLCRESGGIWKQMPTPCKGTCDYERKVIAGQGPLCAQVITQNCDCGEGKCWSGKGCENL